MSPEPDDRDPDHRDPDRRDLDDPRNPVDDADTDAGSAAVPDTDLEDAGPVEPAPDPTAVHERSADLIRLMDTGDLDGVAGLLGDLTGPEEAAAQVVSLASLARLLLDQLPEGTLGADATREAVLLELTRVLVDAEGT